MITPPVALLLDDLFRIIAETYPAAAESVRALLHTGDMRIQIWIGGTWWSCAVMYRDINGRLPPPLWATVQPETE